MFKPVTGEALNNYDEETRALFAKRHGDPRFVKEMMTIKRPQHHHLPILSNPDDPTVRAKEAYTRWLPYKAIAFTFFTCWACSQFTKAYFPYGIILRRSIPTTPLQQFSYKAPLAAVFLIHWYYQREYPRSERCDLTCDSEN